ncbi:MAG: integration host factor subunit beta [Planctomycetaceae bacterium]|jgi:nucleoid DNA-binding protein|nr:integration host factor subunit beta [Planctomycetaceae bacterium]
MTKKDIVRSIAEKLELTQSRTRDIVQRTFDTVIETIVEDGRIELRNFGVFDVKYRPERKARNPKTGQEITVAEKYVIVFKPGKAMERKVNELLQKKKRKK